MPKLVNNETKQVENVSYDQLPDLLHSGSHSMVAGDSLNLLSPDDQPVNVPVEKAYTAIKEGYKFPTQAHVDSVLKDAEMTEKYGTGAANSLKALAAGAARGATFGLSDAALTQSGFASPEALKALKEKNPIASTVGQGAGIAAGLLTGAGEAEGAASAFNLPAQAAKSAATIAENPVVRGAISKYGAAALGSAVEGAAYGAGNVISESALGDPSMNGEKALSEIGIGALIGGGVGGAFSTAANALPAVFTKAQEALSGVKGSAAETLAKGSAAISGKPVNEILTAIQNTGHTLTPEVTAEVSSELSSSLSEQYKLVNQAVSKTFKEIRPAETRALIDNTALPAAQAESNRLFAVTEDAIKTIRDNPELYPQRYAAKLSDWQNTLIKANQEDAASIFEAINDFKTQMGGELKFGKIPNPEIQDALSLLKSVRGEFKDALENEAVFGEAGARQASVNEAYNEFKTLQTEVEKNFMGKRINKAGSVEFNTLDRKVASSLKDPQKVEILSAYQDASKKLLNEIEKSHSVLPGKGFDKSAAEKLLGKNTQLQEILAKSASQDKLMKSLGSGTGGLGDFATVAAGSAVGGPAGALGAAAYTTLKNPAIMVQRLAALEKMFSKVTKVMSADTKAIFSTAGRAITREASAFVPMLSVQEFTRQATQIAEHNQDSERLISKLDQSTRGAVGAAPQTVAALHQTTARAISFLASKIPAHDPQAPLDKPLPVSDNDRQKFSYYSATVKNPLIALKQIKAGNLKPETVETLKVVYPKLYNEMQGHLMDHLVNHKAGKSAGLPLQVQNSMSLFMGHELTSSLKPENMMRNQQAFQPMQAQAQQMKGIRPTAAGLGKINTSNQYLSAMQKSSLRLNK